MDTDDDHRLDLPVHSQADLEELWRRLMGPLGFSHQLIWIMRVRGDGIAVPHLTQVEDVDSVPNPEERTQFATFLRHREEMLPSDGGRWAFLLSRPGRGGAQRFDRQLAAALVGACREHGLCCDVVHLATDDTLVPLPYDELASSA